MPRWLWCGEERHLGVIGHGTDASVRQIEVGHGDRSVARANLLEHQELDGSAQRVSDGAAE